MLRQARNSFVCYWAERTRWPSFLVAISFRVAHTVTQVERVALDPPASVIAAAHEDVTFNSLDGIALSNRVNSDFMQAPIAKLLLAQGYSVLLFDLRGHAESGGTRYTLGLEEPRDILAAIDLAAKKSGLARARVAVIGESLGGGSALMTVQAGILAPPRWGG